jgi:hypothetical protein
VGTSHVNVVRLRGVPGPGPANTRPRGCLDSTRPVVVVVSASLECPLFLLSLSPSFFPLILTPSLLWLPNPWMLPSQPHSNNPHPQDLIQSVPFLPDLPPSVGPKIRKFTRPRPHRSIRADSPHRPNPTIRLARHPFPPPQSPRPLHHPPLQPRARTVTLPPTLPPPVPVWVLRKTLSRSLRRFQQAKRQLSS